MQVLPSALSPSSTTNEPDPSSGKLPLHSIFIAVGLFLYFALWAVIRPPYQSPDEFAHAVKISGFSVSPWRPLSEDFLAAHKKYLHPLLDQHFLIRREHLNPLSDYWLLHIIPHDSKRSLSGEEVCSLKAAMWDRELPEFIDVVTSAFLYPTIYYGAVFLVADPVIRALDAAPYEAFYIYRLASCLLSALAWLGVYLALYFARPFRTTLFIFALSSPMLPFLSSSLSPDALLNPLSALVLILFYQTVKSAGSLALLGVTFVVLVLAGLTKPSTIFMYAPLSLASFLIQSGRIPSSIFDRPWMKGIALCASSAAVSYLLYYQGLPFVSGTPVVTMSLYQYVQAMWESRALWLFKAAWASFGWLEYMLSNFFFVPLVVLLICNAWAALRERRGGNLQVYLLVFFVLFVCELIAAEMLTLERTGLVLQGRYFLPASLALAAIFIHRNAMLKTITLGFLVIMHLEALRMTVDRYYESDYKVLYQSLPFLKEACATQLLPPHALPSREALLR